MEILNRSTINNLTLKDIKVGNLEKMPVKILQYGEGNFLRAFVDYMVDILNGEKIFNGSIAVVQPVENGMVDMMEQQDGLYTVLLRGLENGNKVVEKRIVTSVSDYLNPFKNYDKYISYASSEDLRFVVSNTTEAGITYEKCDMETKPQKSFPAKVTAFLYERYKKFGADKTKGLVFIPCELIDNNGANLKKYVLQHAKDWDLEPEFVNWVDNDNYFTSTLVDRIVTGYPAKEIKEITEELGYKDNLVDTCEIFHNWVIEGPAFLSEELPFHKVGLNVTWTDDAKPYKLRKVRILNGAHTSTVLAGYLSGINIVKELMDNTTFNTYLQKLLFDEVLPVLTLPYEDVKAFADSVFDRFANPFIDHFLLSISLNSVSKYKARVLPTILEYKDKKGNLPPMLMFSFAALLKFYEGYKIEDGALIGKRGNEEYKINDTLEYLETFKALYTNFTDSLTLVKTICGNADMWGTDLNKVDGFAECVAKYFDKITAEGMESAVKSIASQ